MKRILFIILFLLFGVSSIAQQYDSTIVFVNNVKRYKTEYGYDYVNFYNADTLGRWILKFKWDFNYDEKWYIRIDSGYIEVPVAYERYDGDTIFTYFVDSAGNMKLDWTIINYKYEIPTYSMNTFENDVNVTVYDKTVTVTSTEPMKSINAYDITGRSVKYFTPHANTTYFRLYNGVYILRIETNRGVINKKIVVH